MQHPQYVDDIVTYLINNNVVRVHHVLTGTSDAPKPKQIRYKRQVFGRLASSDQRTACTGFATII